MLKNEKHAGKTIVTEYGRIEFDGEGISTDLTLEQAKTFESIPGYEILEDTFQGKDKEDKQQDKKDKKDVKKELEKEPVKSPKKYSKTVLENKTVAEIEDIAKEKGIELQGAVKKEKIKEVLDAQ